MTVWYDADENAIIENNGHDYAEFTDDGELKLQVDEMPPHKLSNIRNAVDDAMEANDE